MRAPSSRRTTVAGAITLITDTRDYCEFSTAMQDGAITTDAIQDDAVTAAKIDNQTRWISRGINTMEADGTNPATLASWGDSGSPYLLPWRPYWSFSATAYNSVWITFQVPTDFVVGGTMTVYIWSQTRPLSATYYDHSRDMQWGFSAWTGGDGDVLVNDTDAATITYPEHRSSYTAYWGYAITYNTAWRYTERDSIGTFSPTAGDIVHMEIYRDGTHGNDTYNQPGALFMVEISYTADS